MDANWDRMEHIANYDTLVHQMLGVPATPWGDTAKVFGHQTLRDNVALLYDPLLQAINVGGVEVDQSVPVADRLLGRYGAGQIASLSFDKGFTRAEDRELLSLYVPTVVMPKRGKKNATETARENGKKFVALRKRHSAVESDINSLEHHGLNRCLDVWLAGYRKYVGYGVLAYNLHVIGRRLLTHDRARREFVPLAA